MTQPRYKRRNYMINPRFQLRFMAFLTIAVLLGFTVLYVSNFLYFDIPQQGEERYLIVSGGVFLFLLLFGLALSHRIAEPLDQIGRIMTSITAEKGDGARVRLRKNDFFPELERIVNDMIDHYQDVVERQNRQALASMKNVTDIKSVAGARILLVEDNDINQELVVELLSSNGVSVEVAANGQEALDILAQDPEFDGVLMDGQMPVMDGYTATRRIREQARFAQLPVIAMTADAVVSDQQKGLDAGMNAHIGKPTNANELFSVMAEWIEPTNPLYKDGALAGVDEQDSGSAIEIEGVDVRQGLARTQGNLQLYLRLLNRFAQVQSNFSENFANMLADDDPQAAERAAHTLKGVAGNIGASQIQQLADQLERACRTGTDAERISELQYHLAQHLRIVVRNIREATTNNSSNTKSELMSPVEYSEKLAELRQMINENDVMATSVVEALRAGVGQDKANELQGITEAITNYDFDKAKQMLDEMDL